jgi:hypothetical protein
MSATPFHFRAALERDIHDAMHPGGQHVGTPKVTLEASRALRLLAVIDDQARKIEALRIACEEARQLNLRGAYNASENVLALALEASNG